MSTPTTAFTKKAFPALWATFQVVLKPLFVALKAASANPNVLPTLGWNIRNSISRSFHHIWDGEVPWVLDLNAFDDEASLRLLIEDMLEAADEPKPAAKPPRKSAAIDPSDEIFQCTCGCKEQMSGTEFRTFFDRWQRLPLCNFGRTRTSNGSSEWARQPAKGAETPAKAQKAAAKEPAPKPAVKKEAVAKPVSEVVKAPAAKIGKGGVQLPGAAEYTIFPNGSVFRGDKPVTTAVKAGRTALSASVKDDRGITTTLIVATAVAKAFVKGYDGQKIGFKDGDPTNCAAANLVLL